VNIKRACYKRVKRLDRVPHQIVTCFCPGTWVEPVLRCPAICWAESDDLLGGVQVRGPGAGVPIDLRLHLQAMPKHPGNRT
jgi:hypothetical protein